MALELEHIPLSRRVGKNKRQEKRENSRRSTMTKKREGRRRSVEVEEEKLRNRSVNQETNDE